MANGVNKVILVGNLGADPETRSFPDGGMITTINIATSETWNDATGQKQERTEWHRVVLKNRGNYRLAEIAAQYLRKGSKVFIEGQLQTRKWQDSNGIDRYSTEVVAKEMQMLDSKPQDQQQGYQQPYQQQPQQSYNQPQQNHMPPPGAHQQAPQNSTPPTYGSFVPNNGQAAYGAANLDEDVPY